MGKKKKPKRKSASRFSRSSRPTREPNKLFLIVCEGGKTEPHFFKGLKRHRRISGARIKVIGGDAAGTDPMSLVNRAIKEIERSNVQYDEVWCVFDKDQHHNIQNAMQKAHAHNIKIAFSNPCFELWYLLYFKKQTAPLTCEQAKEKLLKYMPDYNKARDDLYLRLSDKQPLAMKRSAEIRKRHRENGSLDISNPSTNVDELKKSLEDSNSQN